MGSPIWTALPDGFAGLVGQFGGGEGGAVQPVAPCAPAQDDDQIADAGLGGVAADGQQAGAAAEDQRVAQIAFVIEDRAVDRGQAKLVAIVADARDDAGGDALRVQHARRQVVWG